MVITKIRGLITLLRTTHEPPSKGVSRVGFGVSVPGQALGPLGMKRVRRFKALRGLGLKGFRA